MTHVPKPVRVPRSGLILLLLAMSAAAVTSRQAQPGAAPPQKKGKAAAVAPARGWTEVDRLVSEQKLEEASRLAAQLRSAAVKRGDEADWTRALIRETQLRIALGGYETAVRALKESAWPRGLLSRTALDLYYAQSLVSYARAYAWEISQRERVESQAAVDLKAWTREQIFEEAQRAYLEVWKRRAELGQAPVGALAEYIEPNTYPRPVRGTLRDAVSYLFVELLSDTSAWSPEESHEVFRLDLPALLEEEAAAASPRAADSSAHPLARIVSVLADLEAWHAAAGRREAALEARLERLRRLHASFPDASDRARIRRDLEDRLSRLREVSWWAMGMATLSEFLEAEEVPDNLVRALAAARQGASAFPQSPGGRRCLAIAARIEAPDYGLASMSSDGPGRRSVEVTHKNLPALHFRAFAVDLEGRIAAAQDWNLLPSSAEVADLLRAGRPAREWTVPLPATPDFKSHRTFVTPPLEAPGLYLLAASARKDFGEEGNSVKSVGMIVTDLVLVTRPEQDSAEVRVVSGETGRPVAGAEVALYEFNWREKHRRVESKTTDAAGIARFEYAPGRENHPYFLLAKKSADRALDSNGLSFSRPPAPVETAVSLLYTDRSIYRPGQKVLWKILLFRGRREIGRYATVEGEAVTVSLVDANNQKIDSRTVSTNAFGTASGEFPVPAGRALGQWRLESSRNGAVSIGVEEYKRPTFEVSWTDPQAPLRLNRPAALTGSARYYFGLPVTGGTARWRVTREPAFPWWWTWRGGFERAQTIAQGLSPVGSDGTFRITFTPVADERLAARKGEVTYRYRAVADVTDEGGETRSADRSFRLGIVAVEAAVRMETNFFREGVPGNLTIFRSDLDGAPREGEGAWRLTELSQPEKTLLPSERPASSSASPGASPADPAKVQTPGDRLRPRWDTAESLEAVLREWPDGARKAGGVVTHDAKGEARVVLPPLSSGAWRLHYTTVDAFGARYETSRDFLVAGRKTALKLPAVLLAESSSVPVGGTMRLLATSGLPGQLLFFDLFRDGRLAERRTLSPGEDSVIEIPIGEKDRGGLAARLLAVRDYQFLERVQTVFVPWDDRRLEVSFSTFRDRLRPGAGETWRVTVRAAAGDRGPERAAELLSYMYDRSLDLFRPHAPADPLTFYPNRATVGPVRASLGESYGQWVIQKGFGLVPEGEPLRGDRLKFFEGYGIGGPGARGRRVMVDGVAVGMAANAPPMMQASRVAENASERGFVSGAVEKKAEAERPAPPVALRSEFAETAFWRPHLLTDAQGSAAIEFTVPDSVTSWRVFVHAVTRDLKAGSLEKQVESVKDLMVRPYLPRFLREGDRAEIKIVVNNASGRELSGRVAFAIEDTVTGASAMADFGLEASAAVRPFTVAAGKGADLTFAVTAPKKVGIYAFRATAVSGETSDGELRALPVLPGRLHLAQSRFAAIGEGQSRTLTFEDLRRNDATRVNEQMVVTVDAQLFYSVLNALPYLVNYPYECTEQIANRFLSTGIVSSVYRDFPAVAKMAEELSRRDTALATWDATDPNRKMSLEETPWLEAAKGGRDAGLPLTNVLDPRIAKAEREASLAKLAKAQTSLGGFPWWPGGPPSPYMTLYMMYSFAKAAEFGVEIPREMVQRGWQYLARYFREEYAARLMREDRGWEFLTFLNYAASAYPDPTVMAGTLDASERQKILAFCFKHWREHSPLLKGQLALTLKRMGRPADAKLVWDSVMDSAKTDPDLGTFWAPEARSWLWYNDTIETHAFALRTLTELDPADRRRHGLVQWLFLNKKLNQWKSTRATAEVIYALVHYLKKEGGLGVREEATVTVGGERATFVFEPDRFTGARNQVVVPGGKLDPATASRVTVEKRGKGLAFASATWHFSTERLPEEDRGDFFRVSRRYFRRESGPGGFVLKPLAEGASVRPGDEVEVQISLASRHAAEYVHLRDPRAAGLEPGGASSGYRWNFGIGWYEETRDSGANFFFEQLPAGEYTFKYRLRANMAGTFRVGPATVQSMYAPEFVAYSAGNTLRVSP